MSRNNFPHFSVCLSVCLAVFKFYMLFWLKLSMRFGFVREDSSPIFLSPAPLQGIPAHQHTKLQCGQPDPPGTFIWANKKIRCVGKKRMIRGHIPRPPQTYSNPSVQGVYGKFMNLSVFLSLHTSTKGDWRVEERTTLNKQINCCLEPLMGSSCFVTNKKKFPEKGIPSTIPELPSDLP